MRAPIQTTRSMHRVRSEDEYARAQARALAKLTAFSGLRVEPHVESRRLLAYINDGRWVVDCLCGGGCAADPAFTASRCFDCGAIYPNILFPAAEDRAEIERVLVQREHAANRNWFPHETPERLQAENLQRGLKG